MSLGSRRVCTVLGSAPKVSVQLTQTGWPLDGHKRSSPRREECARSPPRSPCSRLVLALYSLAAVEEPGTKPRLTRDRLSLPRLVGGRRLEEGGPEHGCASDLHTHRNRKPSRSKVAVV